MRTVLVEDWVQIPEGGKITRNHCDARTRILISIFTYSYCDRKDKISEGEGPPR